jgi:hypothetical protein
VACVAALVKTAPATGQRTTTSAHRSTPLTSQTIIAATTKGFTALAGLPPPTVPKHCRRRPAPAAASAAQDWPPRRTPLHCLTMHKHVPERITETRLNWLSPPPPLPFFFMHDDKVYIYERNSYRPTYHTPAVLRCLLDCLPTTSNVQTYHFTCLLQLTETKLRPIVRDSAKQRVFLYMCLHKHLVHRLQTNTATHPPALFIRMSILDLPFWSVVDCCVYAIR